MKRTGEKSRKDEGGGMKDESYTEDDERWGQFAPLSYESSRLKP